MGIDRNDLAKFPEHIREQILEKVQKGTGKKNKYGAKAVWRHGLHFDSTKEADYFDRCLLLHRAKAIDGVIYHGKVLLVDGKGPEERATCYEPDFVVLLPDGRYRIVDTKGFETDVFKLKMKQLRQRWPRMKVETE